MHIYIDRGDRETLWDAKEQLGHTASILRRGMRVIVQQFPTNKVATS